MATSVAYAIFLLLEIIYSETLSFLCLLKMIESRNAVGQYDTTLQLKAQVPYYIAPTVTLDKKLYMFHVVITYVCVTVLYGVLVLRVPFM